MIDSVFEELDLNVNSQSLNILPSVYQVDLPNHFIDLLCYLGNIPEKEWYRSTDDKVLDLVDPSLYCIQYGQTYNSSTNQVVKRPKIDSSNLVVDDFQWIPSEFNVTNGKVTIKSYINNLEPITNKKLYNEISALFEKILPIINRLINAEENNQFQEPKDGWFFKDGGGVLLKNPIFTPKQYEAPFETKWDLMNMNLQVFVKIGGIALDPGQKYDGGKWHLEGTDSEKIVATGIYYYDFENITDSKISFRCAFDVDDIDYLQNDFSLFENVYGLTEDSTCDQLLGSVNCVPGRCVVFLNTLQHKVQPFKLIDNSKPGHRKSIAFFLVNPTIKVASTRDIQPQQCDWIIPILKKATKFPIEIIDKIVQYTHFISKEKARSRKQLLMEARKSQILENHVFEQEISLFEY